MTHLIWIAIAVVAATLAPAAIATGTDPCPAAQWNEQTVAQCIADLAKRIDQLPPQSPQRVDLLEQRARLHEFLYRQRSATGDKTAAAASEAALADYAAALAIAPRNGELRRRRAQWLISMERGDDALKDADVLVAQDQASVQNQQLKGFALAAMKRHKEAIAVFTHAIALTQSCAEASMIQEKINEYRRAFDPPMTKEQALAWTRNRRNMPLHDVPDAGVKQLGFPCTPTQSNTLDEMVMSKSFLFSRRAESHRALGNTGAALRDYGYAVSISSTSAFVSVGLCEMEIDLGLDYSATEHCRQAFGSNSFSILGDAEKAAKIGTYLLEDGDLKSACRIALPFADLPASTFEADKAMQAYLNHPKIKALAQRVRGALAGAGLKRCSVEFRPPTIPN
jgi:tetratricopeptide (TPR) repeat protein